MTNTPEERGEHVYDATVWPLLDNVLRGDPKVKREIVSHIASEIQAAMSCWIPVTDLPEEKLFVLAIDDCGNIHDAYVKDGYWLAPEGRSELLEGVTHWMPRPAPPAQEPTQ